MYIREQCTVPCVINKSGGRSLCPRLKDTMTGTFPLATEALRQHTEQYVSHLGVAEDQFNYVFYCSIHLRSSL